MGPDEQDKKMIAGMLCVLVFAIVLCAIGVLHG